MEFAQRFFINENVVSSVKNAFDASTELLHWQVESDSAESQRHFLSQTSRLRLTCRSAHGVQKYVFFVKTPYDLSKYEQYQVGPVVEKEFEMYKNILPVMEKFSPFDLPSPKCYYVHGDGSFILEDLQQFGFKSFNRGRYLDLEHATYALKALAKFHAVSVKVDKIFPRVLDEIREIKFLKTKSCVIDKNSYFGNRFFKLMARVDPAFVVQNRDILLHFKDVFYQTAVSEACRNDGINVLNHGDFWTSNLMFKYKKGRVEDVKIFDFQFSNWSSPANDLLVFFMMSIEFETFRKYFLYFLGVYLDKFLQTSNKLGCKKSYTMKQLLKDIRSKYNFWILLLIWWGPIFHSTADEFKGDVLAEDLVDGRDYQPFLKKWMSFFIDEYIHGEKKKWLRMDGSKIA